MLVVLRLWESEDENFMLTPSGGSESSMRTQAPAPDLKNALVYGFETPHKIGSICGYPCPQCGDIGNGHWVVTNALGEEIPASPLMILAEATQEQWEQCVIAEGGLQSSPATLSYFYFVSTD
jgi:hypothetical protein